MDWWEEVPDLASSSNGFLFWFKVARVEGVCGVAPHPFFSNRRFWSRDVPASEFPLAPPKRPGRVVPHGERDPRCSALFTVFAKAHELLLLRLVGWRCWMPGRPEWRLC